MVSLGCSTRRNLTGANATIAWRETSQGKTWQPRPPRHERRNLTHTSNARLYRQSTDIITIYFTNKSLAIARYELAQSLAHSKTLRTSGIVGA